MDLSKVLDPDELHLSKKELLVFLRLCVSEWNQNKIKNWQYIIWMSAMITGITATPEPVLKVIWRKIISWINKLQYQNALANDKDTMLKDLGKVYEDD